MEYEVIKKLGEGDFGAAYKVIYRNQYAVIKKLYKEKNKREDFENEANILKTFHSRHVLHYIDSFEEEDYYCIVTEYCPYKTLDVIMRQLRKEKKFLSLYGVLKYFCDILDGLTHLSANNVIHRDLKPENIFITPENVCILGDFGLSMINDDKSDNIGNKLYRPPEVYSKNEYCKNSEIWSIGLILYELSTNKSVQKILKNDFHNLMKMINDENYLRKEYPKHLEPIGRIIDRCLEIDPKKRATIDELKKEEIIKKYMKEAADTLFINDTMDDDEVDDLLERFSHIQPDKLLVRSKDIIGLFKKASRIYLSPQNDWKIFELINNISINVGRTLMFDQHDDNPHYVYFRNEDYDDEWEANEKLLSVILAIFKFLLKKGFNSEAYAIYEGICEERNVKQEFKDRIRKVGRSIIKKKKKKSVIDKVYRQLYK